MIDQNLILGVALAIVGLTDIAIARFMSKLPASARTLLTFAGVAILLFGAALLLRLVRIL